METKSAIVGGLAALAAVGIAFAGFAVANADTTPAPEPSSIVTTVAPAPVQEPAVSTPAPEPTTAAPAPVEVAPAPAAEPVAPVVAEPAPVYVAPAAPAPVYVAPAAPAPAPVVAAPEPTQAPLYKGADGYYYAPDVPTTSGPKIGRAG